MFSPTKLNGGIRPLKSKFQGRGEVKGFNFRLIGMTDKAFIYEVRSGINIHYEVFRKRINKRFSCVTYPSKKSFGKSAWKYKNLCDALIKYNQLNNDENESVQSK